MLSLVVHTQRYTLRSFVPYNQKTLNSILFPRVVLHQVSASLPKTSYFKMVDVWLIFCIGITFLTIIFHVVVDYVVHRHADPGGSRLWAVPIGKGMLNSKNKGTVPGLTELEVQGQRVVLATKVAVPTVFFAFNICYWGYILG